MDCDFTFVLVRESPPIFCCLTNNLNFYSFRTCVYCLPLKADLPSVEWLPLEMNGCLHLIAPAATFRVQRMPRLESNECLVSSPTNVSCREQRRPSIGSVDASFQDDNSVLLGQMVTSFRADEKPPIASNEVLCCGALMRRFESNRCLDLKAPETTSQIQ
jgi:hypothetical protein